MKRILPIILLCVTQLSFAQMYIRYNQAGYYPQKQKRIVVISASNINGYTWNIQNSSQQVVANGTIGGSKQGVTIYTTKAYNYEVNFTTLTQEDDYTFNLQNQSPVAFKITCDPYSKFVFEILKTIRARRSGTSDALVHKISHLGDSSCAIYERNGSNTNWLARSDNKKANMLGGWYDAGDYIKFTLTTAYTSYFILKSFELNPQLYGSVKQYSTSNLCDMLDEAKHGLSYLMRTMPEPGIFIIQTGGHLDHTQGLRLPENDALNGKRECYSALSKTQMGLTVAALAIGARLFQSQGYTSDASAYSAKAASIYAAAKASTQTPAWWAGGYEVYYADNTENDNMLLAAIEMYKLTQQSNYLTDAISYSNNAGAAYWAAWSNTNMIGHSTLLPNYASAKMNIVNDLNYFKSIGARTNNIWHAPHETSWGTLYSYLSVANGALQYQVSSNDSSYQSMAIDVLDYTFGLNPWGLAFVASQQLPKSITSTYAVMYRLQPSIFPSGEIAEGPTDSATHASNCQYFNPPNNPSLWHSEFNSAKFTFFEQPGDYICMETTISGLADGMYLFSLASNAICKNANTATSQTINLIAGWNLISTYLHPTDSSITTIFKNVDVEEIKTFNSFWKKGQDNSLNSLQNIEAGSGYLVKMNASGTLTITGTSNLGGFQNLSGLNNGWHLVGCPFYVATAFSNYLNSSNCKSIKNFDGFWKPSGTVNSLSTFEPGKAYFYSK